MVGTAEALLKSPATITCGTSSSPPAAAAVPSARKTLEPQNRSKDGSKIEPINVPMAGDTPIDSQQQQLSASPSTLHEPSFLSQGPLRYSANSMNCYADDETMEGYSSVAMEVSGTGTTTTERPPSFRWEQHPQQQKSSFTTLSLPPFPVQQRTVKAPPGKLGISLLVTPEGPKVQDIKPGSPMEGLLFVGDVVIRVNDMDARTLSSPAIHKLWEQTNNDQRSIQVLTMDDTTWR
jgi:C-terminal processing protease CtpA/Prc